MLLRRSEIFYHNLRSSGFAIITWSQLDGNCPKKGQNWEKGLGLDSAWQIGNLGGGWSIPLTSKYEVPKSPFDFFKISVLIEMKIWQFPLKVQTTLYKLMKSKESQFILIWAFDERQGEFWNPVVFFFPLERETKEVKILWKDWKCRSVAKAALEDWESRGDEILNRAV